MKRFVKQFMILFALCWVMTAHAADGDVFTATSTEGIEMTFKVISESEKTCQVGDGRVCCLADEGVAGTLTIPATANGYQVTVIGEYAFSGCEALENIILPESLQTIEHAAFEYCGLKTVSFPASLTKIDYSAFSNSALTEVTIPGTVTFDEYAFYHCSDLLKVTIGEGITEVPRQSFDYCEALTTVSLPSTLTTIGYMAFASTTSLGEFIVPEGVTTIGEAAFFSSGLKKITLPSTLTTAARAFKDSSLEEVVIAEGVTDISGWFQGCASLKSICIPASVNQMTNTFNGCSALETIVVAEGNTKYDSRDNCNAIIETATNTLVRACKNTVIPATLTAIGDAAFYGMKGLGSIELPQQVKEIGREAFSDTDLSGISLPAALEYVGTEAFRGTQLTEVVLPDNLEYLSQGMFAECKKLEHVTFGKNTIGIPTSCFVSCTALKEVELPTSITFIYNRAFCKSGLQNIRIPESVTIIGESAFEGCKLDELVVEGCGSLAILKNAFDALIKHLSFLTTFHNINGCVSYSFRANNLTFQAYMKQYVQYGSSVINSDNYDPFIGIRDEWMPYLGSHDNFAVPEGLEAYIVTGVTGNRLQLQQVNSINRDQGVMLHLVDPSKATATIKMSGGDMLRFEAVPVADDQVTDYSGDNILRVTVFEKSAYNQDENIVQFLFNNGVFEQKRLDTIVGLNAYLEIDKSKYGKYKSLLLSSGAVELDEGDANADGEVNVADIDFVIESIGADVETNKAADVNGDGEINVADVDYIIERIK